ncbi:MAG: GreA/GreB family elongation factor [Candidatus Omnitrophota bacterium]|jgi:regulator of nucleoside diphosphate kinase
MQKDLLIIQKDAERLRLLIRDRTSCDESEQSYLKQFAEELLRARIIDPKKMPPDVVTMNSLVKLRDMDSREFCLYRIVYPGGRESGKERVSVMAPIGMVLLGCRVGDVVALPVSGGMRRLQIEKVLYQPESAGHYKI